MFYFQKCEYVSLYFEASIVPDKKFGISFIGAFLYLRRKYWSWDILQTHISVWSWCFTSWSPLSPSADPALCHICSAVISLHCLLCSPGAFLAYALVHLVLTTFYGGFVYSSLFPILCSSMYINSIIKFSDFWVYVCCWVPQVHIFCCFYTSTPLNSDLLILILFYVFINNSYLMKHYHPF